MTFYKPLPFRTLALAAIIVTASASAQTNLLTNRYNQARTAANLSETVLTPANVNTKSFAKLGSYSVDGVIYAQPLYVQGLTINGATHNVLFVATQHDVLYAFDADNVGSTALWTIDFRSATVQPAPIHIGSNPSSDAVVSDTFGIFGTPVIDLSNDRIFFVTHTLENGTEYFRLRNVNLLTGTLNNSTVITGSAGASGSYGAQTFIPSKYAQRAALELVNGQVWVAFGSRPPGDYTAPWEGWVMTYNAGTLAQTGLFVSSRTNGNSIWQSGSGPAVDASGNVYYLTGNGGTYTAGLDLPESLIQFNGTSANLKSWYTPDSTVNNDSNNENYTFLDNYDLDLSCNGPVLIPGTSLVTFGSKTADVFVLSTTDLGQLTPNDPQVIQTFHVGAAVNVQANDSDRIVGMAYWQQGTGGTLFVWPGLDALHAYSLNASTSKFTQTYAGASALPGQPATALAVSANGGTNGILWAPVMNTTVENNVEGQPGILHAYNAANPAQELWNSNMVATDAMGSLAKFVPPVVVNGKVYMANSASLSNWSAGSVTVYGLKSTSFHAPPTVTLTSPSAGASYASGAAITLTASAAATTGSVVSSVTFRDGATNLATITNAPYTFNWTNAAAGNHSLTAVATDSAGSVTTSLAIAITVANSTTTWTEVGVTVNSIAAGSDGTVLVTNSSTNAIWQYVSPNNWVNITSGNGMKALAVIKANVYFGIGLDNNVYRYNGAAWIQVGVNVSSIAAGSDGTVLVTNSANGSIWQYVADNDWVNVTPGTAMKSLAVIGANRYFGIGADNNVYLYNGSAWSEVGVNVDSIAAGSDGTLLVTNNSVQSIWQYPVNGAGNWTNVTPGTTMKALAVIGANRYFGIGLDNNVYFY